MLVEYEGEWYLGVVTHINADDTFEVGEKQKDRREKKDSDL